MRRAEGAECCVVELEGELDLEMVGLVKPRITSMLEGGCSSFVLDMSRVKYADSSALGLIVWLNDRVEPLAGRIVAAGADHNVARILELSGLLSVASSISAAETAEDALAALSLGAVESDPVWSQTFSAPALVSELTALRGRVVELAAPLGLSGQALFDLKVAVGEALANAVRHGSPQGEDDTIEVTVTAFPDRVAVDVADRGTGFDGVLECGTELYSPCGRGVMFMRALTDSAEFRSRTGGGTLVRLVKHLRRPSG